MKRPVRLSALAALDLQKARDWFDAREPGLGDTFLERVNETINRISQNPEQYQVTIADLHRARSRSIAGRCSTASCRIRASSWRVCRIGGSRALRRDGCFGESSRRERRTGDINHSAATDRPRHVHLFFEQAHSEYVDEPGVAM